MLCSAEFELPPVDTDTLAGALDDNYGPPDERDGTDGTARVRRWDYVAPGALGSRILAALTLTGTLQSVESNGTQRFDEVIAVVRAAAPGASVVSETREPAGDMFRRGRELPAASASASASGSTAADSSPGPGGGATESPFLDPSDPVVAEALAEFTAHYENRWLDMELPALAGLTPRQAADDPTRREDLIRLLDSFDGFAQGPGTMSPTRLRRALRL